MQKLVLFDLDNTLIDRNGAIQDWAAQFAARYSLADHAATQLVESVQARAFPATFESIRAQYRLPSSADSLWRQYCSDIAAAVRCPERVLAGMDALRATGWRVGIATNGATDIQNAKLQATGLVGRVDGVCVSESVGARKPSAAVFEAAAVACGSRLSQGGWMVGDNPETDIDGGRRADLRTIWIRNGRPWPVRLAAPDHCVPDAEAAIVLLLADACSRSVTT
ncbi:MULTISPECIES: HAD family hydrolase [Streptomyces]|uniref:HAD family hydrolase n=1 Tax=Streptomyces TaxID=1883 RepID=UPI0002419ECA|nr:MULTISPECIES: HAD family hydrolase [Streptomyces]EHM29113.1 hydrolase [Streptomyces sp. W007]WTD26427.1 HAD family hydrolase [Streptomyces anulatus]